MWMGGELLLYGVFSLIGMAGAYVIVYVVLWILLFFIKGKPVKIFKTRNSKSNLNKEELAEVAKLKKTYKNLGFQKGVEHKYKLWGEYPLGSAFFAWYVLMLCPLLFALWFLPDLEMYWRENLRNFCLIAGIGSVIFITIFYWQQQIKQVWMNEDGELFYKVRQKEKLLKYSDYKYVRVLGDDRYSFRIIFTNEKNDELRLLFAVALNFWPQRSINMPLFGFARLEDRQPVSAKYFTDEIGKSLLKEGFVIKPIENKPRREGWLATRAE
jgi:hypothetical protein